MSGGNDVNELHHYGVPGMRWGVRKIQPKYEKRTRNWSVDKKTGGTSCCKLHLYTECIGCYAKGENESPC